MSPTECQELAGAIERREFLQARIKIAIELWWQMPSVCVPNRVQDAAFFLKEVGRAYREKGATTQADLIEKYSDEMILDNRR